MWLWFHCSSKAPLDWCKDDDHAKKSLFFQAEFERIATLADVKYLFTLKKYKKRLIANIQNTETDYYRC